MMRSLAVILIALAAAQGHAATVGSLLGQPARNLQGERIGTVQDLIIDARAAHLLYVVVENGGRFLTLPARALDERLRLDVSLAGAAAYDRPPPRERFRRAATLIGDQVHRPGEGPIGVIHDIRFDPGTGKVQEVVVRSAERGRVELPPAVLVWGYLPPLTRSPYEPPRYSNERNRLHDHRWK